MTAEPSWVFELREATGPDSVFPSMLDELSVFSSRPRFAEVLRYLIQRIDIGAHHAYLSECVILLERGHVRVPTRVLYAVPSAPRAHVRLVYDLVPCIHEYYGMTRLDVYDVEAVKPFPSGMSVYRFIYRAADILWGLNVMHGLNPYARAVTRLLCGATDADTEIVFE